MELNVLPFSRRKLDWAFVAFFLINLYFVTYIVDIEQLIIPDPYHYQPPPWPPAAMVKLIHGYGQTFDPLVMARPQWWKMTIWLDVLFYGPFYIFAIYAFIKGRDWIRVPAIFYSGMMFADVFIILGEEAAGSHAAPNLPLVFLLNLPWLLLPIFLTIRLQKQHPFESSV